MSDHQPDASREPRGPLSVETRVIKAPPERVFDVLSDAWLMPVWVVGATHMRDVDPGWPSPGTKLYHQVGAWPVAISDTTAVVECEPARRLVLQARAFPFGEARIEITLEPHADGTLVHMGEAPTHGFAKVVDNPLQRKVLKARNRESLERLGAIVEHRDELSVHSAAPARPAGPPPES